MSRCDYCGAESEDTFIAEIPIVKENQYGRFKEVDTEEHTFCEGSACVTKFCLDTFQAGKKKRSKPLGLKPGAYDLADRYTWETQTPGPYRAAEMLKLDWHPPQVVFVMPKKQAEVSLFDSPTLLDKIVEQVTSTSTEE